MNIFEYKELCEDRVEKLEKDLLMEKARLMAVEEIIAMNVSFHANNETEYFDTEQSDVSEEHDCVPQETDGSY